MFRPHLNTCNDTWGFSDKYKKTEADKTLTIAMCSHIFYWKSSASFSGHFSWRDSSRNSLILNSLTCLCNLKKLLKKNYTKSLSTAIFQDKYSYSIKNLKLHFNSQSVSQSVRQGFIFVLIPMLQDVYNHVQIVCTYFHLYSWISLINFHLVSDLKLQIFK